jgi:hypothetical protein
MARMLFEGRGPRKPSIACLVAVLGAVSLASFLVPPRFGEREYRRLRVGMTEAEVVEALGAPAGDYRPAIWSDPDWCLPYRDPVGFLRTQSGTSFSELKELERQDLDDWMVWYEAGQPGSPPAARAQLKRWWARGSGIDVAFDRHGRTIHYSLWDLEPPRAPSGLLGQVRWWLGW